MRIVMFVTLFATALSAGCVHPAVKETANISASLAQDLKVDLSSYIDTVNAVRRSEEERLRARSAQADLFAGRTATARKAWEANGDQDALKLHDALTEGRHARIVPLDSDNGLLAPPPVVTLLQYDFAQHDDLVKKLSEISAGRSPLQSAEALFKYGSEVWDKMSEDIKKAKKEAEASGAVAVANP